MLQSRQRMYRLKADAEGLRVKPRPNGRAGRGQVKGREGHFHCLKLHLLTAALGLFHPAPQSLWVCPRVFPVLRTALSLHGQSLCYSRSKPQGPPALDRATGQRQLPLLTRVTSTLATKAPYIKCNAKHVTTAKAIPET